MNTFYTVATGLWPVILGKNPSAGKRLTRLRIATACQAPPWLQRLTDAKVA